MNRINNRHFMRNPFQKKTGFPRRSRWSMRLSLFQKSLDTTMLTSQQLTAERLERERLTHFLEAEKARVKMLMGELDRARESVPALMAELERIKKESGEGIRPLSEEFQALADQKRASDEELSKLREEFEKIKDLRNRTQVMQSRRIEDLMIENSQLTKKQAELRKQIHELTTQFQARTRELEASLSGMDVLSLEQDEQHPNPDEERKSLFRRCFDWLVEPVSTISLPNRRPKSPN